LVSAVSTPAGALVVAGSVALYHTALVWIDAQRRAVAAGGAAMVPSRGPERAMPAAPAGSAPASIPAPAGGMPPGAARRRLVLTADSEPEMEAALAAVRSALPPGTTLDAE
jgi:hypothetical protein